MRHPFPLSVLAETPWAIAPDVLRSVLAGGLTPEALPSSEDVQARFAVAAAARQTQRASAVAVIPVYGVIRQHGGTDLFSLFFGGATVDQITADFRSAMADEAVRAVVFDIDSPGGSVFGITELANEIFKARGTKPIVALANATAASAAYAIAAACDEVFVTPSGQAGSIGVYVVHQEFSEFDKKLGIATTLISAGKFKTEGNEFEPLADEAREHLQGHVNSYYEVFVRDVARFRATTEARVRGGYGEGRVLTAKDAVSEGLADGVRTLDQAIARIGAAPAAQREVAAEGGALDIGENAELTAEEQERLRAFRALRFDVLREEADALSAA